VRLEGEIILAIVIHAPGHEAALPLITVVDHGEGVHIFVASYGKLRGNIRPEQHPVLFCVIDPGAVGDDEPAHAGKFLHRLGDAPEDPPGGGNGDPAPLRRRGDGPEVFLRNVLVVVQKGAVQVEGQEHPAHARFRPFFRPRTVARYSSAPWKTV
jgi:hypothetical protein